MTGTMFTTTERDLYKKIGDLYSHEGRTSALEANVARHEYDISSLVTPDDPDMFYPEPVESGTFSDENGVTIDENYEIDPNPKLDLVYLDRGDAEWLLFMLTSDGLFGYAQILKDALNRKDG